MASNHTPSIAVIGSGISGIVSAYLLDRIGQVTLIEASDRLGGHTHTVSVDDTPPFGIDTGFIVFNALNYPMFCSFLTALDVPYHDSDMSFGFYDPSRNVSYCSDFPYGLFPTLSHLITPSHWQFLWGILQFNRMIISDLDENPSLNQAELGEYLAKRNVPKSVINDYVIPMGAAIWSCDFDTIRGFPASHFFSFWRNHQLLQVRHRPQWKTVSGGAQRYIDAFCKQFSGIIHRSMPVTSVRLDGASASITYGNKTDQVFDYVVIATHADQALAMLDSPTDLQRRLLSEWRYSNNRVYLHTDASVMPPLRHTWASWNVQKTPAKNLVMSYYMNRLQGLLTSTNYFVTLNDASLIDSSQLIRTIHYTHPQYTAASIATQPQLPQLNSGPIRFCGSYFGFGFHEDGVASACNVAKQFGVAL